MTPQMREAPEAASSEGNRRDQRHDNHDSAAQPAQAQAQPAANAVVQPMPLHVWARGYASLGLHPIRVYGFRQDGSCECGKHPAGDKSAGKHPVGSGWQSLPLDIEQLCSDLAGHPRANIGLRMGRQPDGTARIALDVDDVPSATELEPLLGVLPETLTQITGSGGMHLVFEVPLDVLPRLKNWTKRHGIDLRTEGGHVVAPPSSHASGKAYIPRREIISRPVSLPQPWLDWLLAQSGGNVRERPSNDVAAVSPAPHDAAWHERLTGAIAKDCPEQGHSYRLAVASTLRSRGLNEGTAAEILCEAMRQARAGRDAQHAADDARRCVQSAYNHDGPAQGAGTLIDVHKAHAVMAELDAGPEGYKWTRGMVEDGYQQRGMVTRSDSDDVAASAQATVDLSGLQLHPQTGLPWIVRDKQACWLHALDGGGYGPAVAKCDVRLEVMRTLGRLVHVEHEGKALGEQTFDKLYVQRAAEVVQTYVARTSTFDPANRRLTLAALRWTKRRAQRHADVESWLKALAVTDDQFDRLNQWLAGLVALDRPAPILHVHGPAGIGKDLLAHGIASLWSGAPSLIDESLSDFNEASASMPIIWSDEQLPAGTDFGWLRHAATARTRRVNMKYLSKVDVEGCARLIMTSNDPDILRFVRTGVLKRVDLDAVRERLLVIDARASDARGVLSQLDTSSIAKGKLAEHCLWLSEAVPLEPMTSRMCARPYGGERPLEVHAGQRNAKVLRAIAARLPADGAPETGAGFHPPGPHADGRPGEGVWLKAGPHGDEPDALLVNVQLLATAAGDLSGRNPVTEQDVRDCCEVYATGEGSRQVRLPGAGERSSPLKWRVLDLARVRAAVRTLD